VVEKLDSPFLVELDVQIQSFFTSVMNRRFEALSKSRTVQPRPREAYPEGESLRRTLSFIFLENIGTAPLATLYDAVPGQSAAFGLLSSSCEGAPDFGPEKYCKVKKPNVTSALYLLEPGAFNQPRDIESDILCTCIAMAYQRFGDVRTGWATLLPLTGFLPLNDWVTREQGTEAHYTGRREVLECVALQQALINLVPNAYQSSSLESILEMLTNFTTPEYDSNGMMDWRKEHQKSKHRLLESPNLTIFNAALIGSSNDILKVLQRSTRESIVNDRDARGNTPLVLACMSGNFESASCLLDRGADASLSGWCNSVCFHFLFTFLGEEQKRIAEKLRDKGARVNEMGRGVRLISVDKLLFNLIDGVPLHSAILANDLSAVQILMSYGSDPLQKNGDFITPLELAACLNTSSILQYLFENTAVNASTWEDHYGNNLVFHALNAKWTKHRILLHHVGYFAEMKHTLTLLRDKSANFKSICHANDISALHFAISNCPSNTVVFLLSLGLRNMVNQKANYDGGRTPLMRSISRGDESAFLILLEYGADVTAKTPLGETALHFCAMGSHNDDFFVRMLVERGADVDAQDAKGQTPLLIAVGRRRFKVAEALLKAGANKEHTYQASRRPRTVFI